MRQLSPTGQQALESIAQRHGIGLDGALHMLDALVRGGGGMAQFNHPDFAGAGQWMRGGMTMVSDLFNNALKYRVDTLCQELSDLLARQPDLVASGSFQSQSQGTPAPMVGLASSGGGAGNPSGDGQLFAPAPPDWWGPTLRWPNSTGSQNGMRYAVFSQAQRLAVDQGGTVTVYDTLDHQIGGVSQQQSGGSSLGFTSQYGQVDLSRLPVVSVNGQTPLPAPAFAATGGLGAPSAMGATSDGPGAGQADVLATIERLGDLRAKGLLDEAEFQAKKRELLARL